METRHSDNDGSDIFWPGYVDATTNLILNLLFLLTILIVAVFMFALELGRSSPIKPENPPIISSEKDVEVVPEAEMAATVLIKQVGKDNPVGISSEQNEEIVSEVTTGSGKQVEGDEVKLSSGNQEKQVVSDKVAEQVKENIALKREIQRLNMIIAQRLSQETASGGLTKSVSATGSVPKLLKGLDKAIVSDLEVVVRFKKEAVEFTPEERNQLLESLKPLVEKGKISIYVEVPAGFSEAKRMGFYRAMAVRNLLIEMELPKEDIEVSVHEGKNNANASLVRVRAL